MAVEMIWLLQLNFLDMDLHKINFWKRLEMFVENVQVNDAMSHEEQEMIIIIAQDQQKSHIPVVVQALSVETEIK